MDTPTREASPMDGTPPTLADVAAGALLWQQEDPHLRQVSIDARGHVVAVRAMPTPFSRWSGVRFLSPFPGEAVALFLDGAVASGDGGTVEVGGFTLSDDDGDIER
jgi:hypothetical protein